MFRVLRSSLFERDIARFARKHREIVFVYEQVLEILSADPYNRSRLQHIKKLNDIKQGKGQWCLRIGNWRIRYDMFGTSVILHSFKPRPEAYR